MKKRLVFSPCIFFTYFLADTLVEWSKFSRNLSNVFKSYLTFFSFFFQLGQPKNENVPDKDYEIRDLISTLFEKALVKKNWAIVRQTAGNDNLSKGQSISKGLFGVFNYSKKQTKKRKIRPTSAVL